MTDKAEKLLRLALDSAAHDGEWRNAAVMFVADLRKSGTTAESITSAPVPDPPPWSHKPPSPKMPFGKYKGQPLSGIPTDYLDWLAKTVDLRTALKRDVKAELHRRA